MAFRNIVIENPAHISLKRDQLIIRTDSEHSLPVEDVSALLLESRQSTITTAALSFLGQSGCAVFVCDEKHMPCAVLTPFARHSRELSLLRAQMEAGEPLKKRLWQSVVAAKVRNQARCLRLCGKEAAARALEPLAGQVRSGDPDNVEAAAAQMYFPALFGPGFVRSSDTATNSALNYGYAIVRGCMARFLTVYGLLPALGLHHRNQLNSFNLADDMMEPFRPLVDLLVAQCFEQEEELLPAGKRLLFNLLNLDILSGGQRHSASYAMERCVQSLSQSLLKKGNHLSLPELVELRQHRYE